MAEKVLAKIEHGKGFILIRETEFKGKTYLDVRKFFVDADSGQLMPTQKGIAILPSAAPKVIAALVKIAEEGRLPVNEKEDER